MNINLYESPFSKAFFSDFRELTATIFEDSADKDWLDSLQWRLENMPNATVFIAEDGSKLIGYQVGYATAYNRYYNWLNGVIPEYRRRGIAKELMRYQYEWLQGSHYKSLEVQIEQHNTPMIQLSLDCGFNISGFYEKDDSPYLIMSRRVQAR